MPMLHGCAYPGCSTFTLSTYCVEHELLVRALKESERTHGHEIELTEPEVEALAAAIPEPDVAESAALN